MKVVLNEKNSNYFTFMDSFYVSLLHTFMRLFW